MKMVVVEAEMPSDDSKEKGYVEMARTRKRDFERSREPE